MHIKPETIKFPTGGPYTQSKRLRKIAREVIVELSKTRLDGSNDLVDNAFYCATETPDVARILNDYRLTYNEKEAICRLILGYFKARGIDTKYAEIDLDADIDMAY